MPIVVIYIVAFMLFLGALPLPYGYYMLLKAVAAGAFIWAAVVTFENKYSFIPWCFVLGAIVFNPIVKIYFDKELWIIIDIIAGLFLLVFKTKIEEQKTYISS